MSLALVDGDLCGTASLILLLSELNTSSRDGLNSGVSDPPPPPAALVRTFSMLCLSALVVNGFGFLELVSDDGGAGHSMVSSDKYPSEDVVSVGMKRASARTS